MEKKIGFGNSARTLGSITSLRELPDGTTGSIDSIFHRKYNEFNRDTYPSAKKVGGYDMSMSRDILFQYQSRDGEITQGDKA